MKNCKFQIVFLILAFVSRAGAVISYNPKDWPLFVVKFSQEGTLKDVYDSGLRPWLPRGFENSHMMFKHARVVIQTHESMLLPEFPVEYADIYTTRDGRLQHVDMMSPECSFSATRTLVIPWFPKIGKTEKQLDSIFEIVRENQIGYEDRDFGKAPEGFGGGWLDGGKVAYGIGLRNNKNPNMPFRIFLGVDWYKLRTERDRSRIHIEPIKPPPGYENASLVPPKNWGADSTVEKMRALDLDTGESPEAVAEQRRNGERPPLRGVDTSNNKAPAAAVTQKESEDRFPWDLFARVALGVGAICFVGWLALRARRGRRG